MLKIDARNFGNVAVLGLQGQIVNGETEILREFVQSLSAVSVIKLDLARVTTVDAGGLGVMLALREQVESQGIRYELMNVPKRVSRRLVNSYRLFRVARERRSHRLLRAPNSLRPPPVSSRHNYLLRSDYCGRPTAVSRWSSPHIAGGTCAGSAGAYLAGSPSGKSTMSGS